MTQFSLNTESFDFDDIAKQHGWTFDGFPTQKRIDDIVTVQGRIFAVKIRKTPSNVVYGNLPQAELLKKFQSDCNEIAAFEAMRTQFVCFKVSPDRLVKVGWKHTVEKTAFGNLLIFSRENSRAKLSVHFCTTQAQALFMGNGIFTFQGQPMHPQPETMYDIFELHLNYGIL